MRTLLQLTALATALVALLPAAGHAASIDGYEVQAGAANSSFQGEVHDVFGESLTSITGGVALRIRLSEAVSIQPELRWIQKGGGTGPISIYSGPDVFTFPSLEWVVNYLDVPLLARIEAPTSGVVHPYLLLGSGVAFKVGGDVRGGGFSTTAVPTLRYAQIFEGLQYSNRNVVDGFRDIDLDATLGMGFGIGRGASRVTLEARWIEGLLDPTPDGSDLPARNRAFTATLGYAWR